MKGRSGKFHGLNINETRAQSTARQRRTRSHRRSGASAAWRLRRDAGNLLPWSDSVCPGVSLLLDRHEPQPFCQSASRLSRARHHRVIHLDEVLSGVIRPTHPRAARGRTGAALELSPDRSGSSHASRHSTLGAFFNSAVARPYAALRVGLRVLPKCYCYGRRRFKRKLQAGKKSVETDCTLDVAESHRSQHRPCLRGLRLSELGYGCFLGSQPAQNAIRRREYLQQKSCRHAEHNFFGDDFRVDLSVRGSDSENSLCVALFLRRVAAVRRRLESGFETVHGDATASRYRARDFDLALLWFCSWSRSVHLSYRSTIRPAGFGGGVESPDR